ncbi:MAG: urea carboxylase [Candidatus Thiodiazotropha lotti]|uniref:Biotin carboxylase n=1 Tax=Candidatus Thiodiazotropha lotti TaxID=2792787 RepID=A0A9E4K5S8_9GAMM|nr:urea carboxylase [Candidatus Thiodiazotropha lotti]MCW4203426.1 urea carboxylase [Candidatus Thiodiazotropha lotti]
MFSKVMIANRGAIATRIIRTLHRLHIPSLAIYAESDADSLHVRHADQAFSLGDGVAADTYLDMDKIIAIAKANGVDAIHPGYGFLSENADFVRRCEAEGIVFIGPTPEQMELFGLKHKARELAQQADVPLTPGTELLQDLQSALAAAETIGYPVMLKSTAGGGGIGMQLCHSSAEVTAAFDSVKRLGANNFANDGVFIEKFIARARHIEVQVFGDGEGGALAIGERDCSSQRRNQKVVEECPAPNLTDEMRQQLYRTAESLLSSVHYRNAGTVEFIYDADTDAFYFLEVNTRLQVEHGVTEEVYGIDLVAWMIRQAAGDRVDLQRERATLSPQGHAVQVRLYAEDPYRDFQPSPGLLTEVLFPDDKEVRIDHWVESGVEVPAYFDPMLAKVIVHAAERKAAFAKLQATLAAIRLYGSETNLDYLSVLSRDPLLLAGEVTTRYLNDFVYTPSRIDVLQGGTQTTIQDYPARTGYWDVGVPPSGPFDNYSFQLANQLLGNPAGVAGMEITIQGPSLKFSCDSRIALTGAEIEAHLDGEPLAMWRAVEIHAGQTLTLGRIKQQGARSYLAVSGGIHCPDYLGSKSTFTLGQFGGHNGRALRAGDVLRITSSDNVTDLKTIAENARPQITHEWQLRVIYGPHGAPDFFTQPDIDRFFSHQWEVHYNSSRTGIRLIGPKPEWARKDGGEAGLHPSNIHDNAYAFGAVDFTGDMPVILGPDGPSLGGFVCPATVIQADLWKLGQLRAGDKVSFVPVNLETAVRLERDQIKAVAQMRPLTDQYQPTEITTPVVGRLESSEYGVDVVYRLAGDHFMLVEYGEQALDISLRFRAHALMQWLQQHPLNGLQEMTPGIRSLQIHYDAQRLSQRKLLLHLKTAEHALASQIDQLHVPSRIVHIPLSWDDEACHKAVEKYDQSVRKNAPWCPSNLEFIRRINGLQSIDDVKRIVFEASYLVMGLGDVYLGAPVATPVDPRHRLVTTKYNPARTWTAENSVGIGGSYLCVYGMEGPGGYQFVGRTLQMWNRYKQTTAFEKPWLLRFFDQIRFYEVTQDELVTIRKDFPQGRYPIKIEESRFSLTEYQAFIHSQQAEIEAFRQHRQQAFEAELAQWHADGQFNFEVNEQTEEQTDSSWPEESLVIDSPISGSVWQTEVSVGQQVKAGECLMILESMKMEIPVYASADSTVTHVLLENGQRVGAGQALVVLQEG